jgi:hypothetical protein
VEEHGSQGLIRKDKKLQNRSIALLHSLIAAFENTVDRVEPYFCHLTFRDRISWLASDELLERNKALSKNVFS